VPLLKKQREVIVCERGLGSRTGDRQESMKRKQHFAASGVSEKAWGVDLKRSAEIRKGPERRKIEFRVKAGRGEIRWETRKKNSPGRLW